MLPFRESCGAPLNNSWRRQPAGLLGPVLRRSVHFRCAAVAQTGEKRVASTSRKMDLIRLFRVWLGLKRALK